MRAVCFVVLLLSVHPSASSSAVPSTADAATSSEGRDCPAAPPSAITADSLLQREQSRTMVPLKRKDGNMAGECPNGEMTWAQCRMKFENEQLKDAEQSTCQACYSSRPTKRGVNKTTHLFGVRWVVLADMPETETILEDQLRVMNLFFNPAGIAFETKSKLIAPTALLRTNDDRDIPTSPLGTPKDFDLQPGHLGLNVDADGFILKVTPGLAEEEGVKAGWVIAKIDGQNFSSDLLREKEQGTNEYSLTVLKDELVLGNLTADIALYLGMDYDASSEEEIFEKLQSRMRAVGVGEMQAASLTSDKKVGSKGFLQQMARLEPHLINIFILASGQNGGTRSPLTLDGPAANIGQLSCRDFIPTRGDIRLAHEMGHFFGLEHSHGDAPWDPAVDRKELEFDAAAEMGKWGDAGVDAFTIVSNYLGANLRTPVVPDNLYLPYDASDIEYEQFTDFVLALIDVYVQPDHLYLRREKNGKSRMRSLGSPTSKKRLKTLRDLLAAGTPLYWKVQANKKADKSRTSNCNDDLDDPHQRLRCDYVDDISLLGDSPLLNDLVTTDDGRCSDLMSYVMPTTWDVEDPQKGFTTNQIKMLQVYVNAPWMGFYQNYRLD